MGDELFVITKENLETGLRGYPVGYCTTSAVHPTKGISYVEHSIESVAYWDVEKVIYLLYFGKEPTESQLSTFKKDLEKRSKCNPQALEAIAKLPTSGHPMKLFCAALLIFGMYETTGDYKEDCLNVIAKIPTLTAAVIRQHSGWKTDTSSKPQEGYIEKFVYELNPPDANHEDLLQVLKLFTILHFDHGGGNLSTFVGKAVASGLEDMYGSLCAAMCGLAGPKHGKANQDCLRFVSEILEQVGADATSEDIAKLLEKKLENHELIFGFGHAVLREEDPRAKIFFEFAQKKYPDFPLYKIAKLLREVGPDILKKHSQAADPYPNVDAISGTVLAAGGFNYPQYFTILFGMSRIVGIAIQIVYERCEARSGKGTPIVRPSYIYKSREQH